MWGKRCPAAAAAACCAALSLGDPPDLVVGVQMLLEEALGGEGGREEIWRDSVWEEKVGSRARPGASCDAAQRDPPPPSSCDPP